MKQNMYIWLKFLSKRLLIEKLLSMVNSVSNMMRKFCTLICRFLIDNECTNGKSKSLYKIILAFKSWLRLKSLISSSNFPLKDLLLYVDSGKFVGILVENILKTGLTIRQSFSLFSVLYVAFFKSFYNSIFVHIFQDCSLKILMASHQLHISFHFFFTKSNFEEIKDPL